MEYNKSYIPEKLSKSLDDYLELSADKLSDLSQLERMHLALLVIQHGKIEDEHTDSSLVIPRFDYHTNVLTKDGREQFIRHIASVWWNEIKEDIRHDTDNWYNRGCKLGAALDTHLINEISYRWDCYRCSAFIKGSTYYKKFNVEFNITTPDDTTTRIPLGLNVHIVLNKGTCQIYNERFSLGAMLAACSYSHRGEYDFGLDELECLHDLDLKKQYDNDYRRGWGYRLSNMYTSASNTIIGIQLLYALLPKLQHLKANLVAPVVSKDFIVDVLKSPILMDDINKCLSNLSDVTVNGQVLKDVIKKHIDKELKEAIKYWGGD